MIKPYRASKSMQNAIQNIKQIIDQDKANSRIILITRIFEYEQYMGILGRQVSRNKYYYNDRFDELYDMNYYHLEELEQNINEAAINYKRMLR